MGLGLGVGFCCKVFVLFFVFFLSWDSLPVFRVLLDFICMFWTISCFYFLGTDFFFAYPNIRNISPFRNSKFLIAHIHVPYIILSTSQPQKRFRRPVRKPFLSSQNSFLTWQLPCFRIIADIVNTVMTIVSVQLIDRVDRRHLVIIGAIGMCISEFMVAIVRVTAGKITADTAVNLSPQKMFFDCVCVLVTFLSTLISTSTMRKMEVYNHKRSQRQGGVTRKFLFSLSPFSLFLSLSRSCNISNPFHLLSYWKHARLVD